MQNPTMMASVIGTMKLNPCSLRFSFLSFIKKRYTCF
jgi:hypothetical protein